MGLLENLLITRPGHECYGQKTYLRTPRVDDFAQWRDLRSTSRKFLEPWEPSWADDELLLSSFRRRISHYAKLVNDDLAYPFFIFTQNGEHLLGAVTVSNIRRGVAQMATLGYWTGEVYANNGIMTDAIKAIIHFADEELQLNRLEAACLPGNLPSIRLLQRTGFIREGFAQSYLKINGKWEDHVLWGRRV